MENRSGLLADASIMDATLFEPKAAEPMLDRRRRARQGMTTLGGFRKSRFVGIVKTHLAACMVGAAYNLLRMARLQPNTG